MNAEIINVGSELLIGDTVSNSQQFLVSELANIDINVYCTNTAGFDAIRLRELLSIALTRSDVILIVGGMGPNVEDITKQTVCDALGLTLVPHDISRKRIEEYCKNNGIPVTDVILSMANMPAGSVVFRNDNGMCPGCAIRSSKQCIVMLPSSTVEMTPMVRSYVSQYLKQLTDGAVFSQVINIFYIGVSLHDVEQRLGNLLSSTNPTVRCFEMTGEVRVRVTARTGTEQMSRDMAAPVIRQIIDIFGDEAYGMNIGGLEEVVVRELKERKMTLSTAESCTAGIISKRITDIPGSSRVFEMGAATYSSNKKSDMLGVSEKIIQRFGAVSPEAAAAMAVGARRLAGSSLGVSTTGIAGPGGGTALKPVGLVYIGLADKENVWIRKLLIQKPGMDRDYVRQVAASHALNMVRMYINSLPYLMPGYEPLGEGVKESYFDSSTALSPQAMKSLAASVPVASIGINPDQSVQQDIADSYLNSGYGYQQPAPQPVPQPVPSYPTGTPQNISYQNTAPGRKSVPKSAPNMEVGNMSKKKKKKSGRSVMQQLVFYLALLVMLGSGGYLLYNLVIIPYISESEFDEYRNVHDDVNVSSAENGVWNGSGDDLYIDDAERNPDGTLKSFTELLAKSSDIVGWITIPNTVIDYPVVQYPGDFEYAKEHGEDYYLHKNLEGKYDANGTIYAFYGNDFGLNEMSQNTILFGHHMKSGKMFQNLMKYDVLKNSANLQFYKENPVIRFDTKYNEYQWVIFSIVKCATLPEHGDDFVWVRNAFENTDDFANFIGEVRARSIIDTSSCIDVNTDDHLLCLQTCSYEYKEFRTVVFARRLRQGETSIDVSSATIASNPKMPPVWNR